jgi:hypothetical protein
MWDQAKDARRDVGKTRIGPNSLKLRIFNCELRGQVLVCEMNMPSIEAVQVYCGRNHSVPGGQLVDLEMLGRCFHDGHLYTVERKS